MSFKVLFLSYEENMISDEEFLLLYDEYSSKNPEFEPLVSTCLDIRRGCHAAKILPVCVRFASGLHLLQFVSLCNDLRNNLLSSHADDT